ncbi:AraC family transcriptional regulator ligand-binding domain-containing protein [Acetobacter cibinongensis]|uniref:AraC family transcriptional regulator ligand-binding domain-containing protein n=1 Tax=Acetobacter cibinongensis TaxID=146475 RepID=UPI000A3BF6E6|nr:AraC family transcriptional regulator ligand-binding domain-containing protein [Acetobacter cibinongensis]
MMIATDMLLSAAIRAGYLTRRECAPIQRTIRAQSAGQAAYNWVQVHGKVLADLVRRTGADVRLGSVLAQHVALQDCGVVGQLVAHSASLSEAYQMMSLYSRLIHPAITVNISKTRYRAEVVYEWSQPHGSTPAVVRHAGQLWALVNMVRLPHLALGLETPPLRVEAACPAPGGQSCSAMPDCPIIFDRPFYKAVFERTAFERPVHDQPDRARAYLEELTRRMMAELPAPHDMVGRVKAEIQQQMGQGPCTVGSIAARLGYSVRTLQRELEKTQAGFRDILDAVRYQEAEKHLKSGQWSKAALASHLGYSDQTAFARAARRWRQTPPV